MSAWIVRRVRTTCFAPTHSRNGISRWLGVGRVPLTTAVAPCTAQRPLSLPAKIASKVAVPGIDQSPNLFVFTGFRPEHGVNLVVKDGRQSVGITDLAEK
jgi:hypothetical protein